MRAQLLSLAIHLGVIALLLMVSTRPIVTPHGKESVRFNRLYLTQLVAPLPHHGGGGGGERSLLPASRGRLPKPARRQFTPPSAVKRDVPPVLPVEPTLVMPPDVRMPAVSLARFGDPNGVDGPPSNGPGSGGGIGKGSEGGVGDHNGPSYGPDDGGGATVVSAAGRITAPTLLYKVEPEFSEEARKAKYQGIVVLTIEVGEDGRAHSFQVVQGLGLGLDEKAIEAVTQWKFRPAQRNGRPVRAAATIEVNFRLL
jgi:periplasmic protein TonB